MTKGLAVLTAALLASAAGLALLQPWRAPGGPTHPAAYWREDLLRSLSEVGTYLAAIDCVRHNPSADALFILGRVQGGTTELLVNVRAGRAETVAAPSQVTYVGPAGEIAAWLDTNGDTLRFIGGQSVRLPRFALFDLDPTARYFVIGEKPARTYIGRASNPGAQYMISSNLLADRIFSGNNLLYVCGHIYGQEATQAYSGAACLIVTNDGSTFAVLGEHRLVWAAGISDITEAGDRLLVQGKGDLNTAIYLYEMKTRRRTRVGTAAAFNFLLTRDPFGTPKRFSRNLPASEIK